MIKVFIIFLTVSASLCISTTSHSAKKENQKWAQEKTLYLYRTWDFSEKDKPALIALEREIELKLQSSQNNPVLWFLKARTHRILLSLWIDVARKSKENIETKKKEYSKLVNRFRSGYSRALSLDENKNSKQHLNAYMLTTITNDVLGMTDQKIAALRRQIVLKEKPDNVSGSYVFDLYSKMYSIYLSEKRYDDALAVMDEMLVHLPGWKEKIKQNKSILEQQKRNNKINNTDKKSGS